MPLQVKNGRLLVYDGKLALDPDQCDCDCGEECCCDDLPDEMEITITHIVFQDASPWAAYSRTITRTLSWIIADADFRCLAELGVEPSADVDCGNKVWRCEFDKNYIIYNGSEYVSVWCPIVLYMRCIRTGNQLSFRFASHSYEGLQCETPQPGCYAMETGYYDCPITNISWSGSNDAGITGITIEVPT